MNAEWKTIEQNGRRLIGMNAERKTIDIKDQYRSAGAFTGSGDLGRVWRFGMNAKVRSRRRATATEAHRPSKRNAERKTIERNAERKTIDIKD